MGMDRDTDHLPDMKPGENINDWMDRAFPDDKATETDDDPRTRRLRILSAILLMASFAATILVGVLFASHAAPRMAEGGRLHRRHPQHRILEDGPSDRHHRRPSMVIRRCATRMPAMRHVPRPGYQRNQQPEGREAEHPQPTRNGSIEHNGTKVGRDTSKPTQTLAETLQALHGLEGDRSMKQESPGFSRGECQANEDGPYVEYDEAPALARRAARA